MSENLCQHKLWKPPVELFSHSTGKQWDSRSNVKASSQLPTVEQALRAFHSWPKDQAAWRETEQLDRIRASLALPSTRTPLWLSTSCLKDVHVESNHRPQSSSFMKDCTLGPKQLSWPPIHDAWPMHDVTTTTRHDNNDRT